MKIGKSRKEQLFTTLMRLFYLIRFMVTLLFKIPGTLIFIKVAR